MSDPATRSFWDARYKGADYRFGEKPNAFLQREAGRLAGGGRVLAIADGEGRNGVWLARQGLDVLSTDISPLAVAKARDLAARHGVAIDARVADLADWEWPVAEMDAVVAIFIQFAGPPLRDRVFDGIRTALKPGGLLLMQGYRPEQLANGTGGPSDPDALYTEALLRGAFPDFEILSLTAHDVELSEGSAHAGPSAVIDLVARKPA